MIQATFLHSLRGATRTKPKPSEAVTRCHLYIIHDPTVACVEHMNPYGRCELDMNTRLPLD